MLKRPETIGVLSLVVLSGLESRRIHPVGVEAICLPAFLSDSVCLSVTAVWVRVTTRFFLTPISPPVASVTACQTVSAGDSAAAPATVTAPGTVRLRCPQFLFRAAAHWSHQQYVATACCN